MLHSLSALLAYPPCAAYHCADYYPETGINTGERDAFVACVESYLLDSASRINRTVKLNVAWDENDYQVCI